MKLAIAAALLAALTISSTASGTEPKVKKALFKVTLEGVQRDKWKAFHQGTGGCDATVSQRGSEVLKFHSKPVLIEATDLEGLSNPVLRKQGRNINLYPFKLRGTVKRNSSITVTDSPAECGGTGGGGKVPKDCGTKPVRGLKAGVDYAFGKPAGHIQVTSAASMNDVFRNCGPGTQSFPHLLATKTDNSKILSELPREELFDKSLGKIIVIGRGKRVQDNGEGIDTASIRWEVTFKRVKR